MTTSHTWSHVPLGHSEYWMSGISAEDCQGQIRTYYFPGALQQRTYGVMSMITCSYMQKTHVVFVLYLSSTSLYSEYVLFLMPHWNYCSFIL